nr:hypothetical protein [Qipengyuania gaetbuli]
MRIGDIVRTGTQVRALRDHAVAAHADMPLVVVERLRTDQHVVAQLEIGGPPNARTLMDTAIAAEPRTESLEDQRTPRVEDRRRPAGEQ